MISTNQAVTAAIVGILSSLFIIFYGESTISFSLLDSMDGKKQIQLQLPDPPRTNKKLVPSCVGVNFVNNLSSLKQMKWVLVDVDKRTDSKEWKKAQDMAEERWDQRGECNVGFVDFLQNPELAAALKVTQMPSWKLIDKDGYSPNPSLLSLWDCKCTAWMITQHVLCIVNIVEMVSELYQ